MEIYNTEEEQVEALKQWWEKNGIKVIVFIVLLLGSVYGGQQWRQAQHDTAAAASSEYSKMMENWDADREKASEHADALLSNHGDTNYAALASLTLAASAIELADRDGAAARLNEVIRTTTSEELKALAALRLARIYLDKGEAEQALSTLNQLAPGAYEVAALELKGDIYLQQGKPEEARTAYDSAITKSDEMPGKRAMLEMKRDDLTAHKG